MELRKMSPVTTDGSYGGQAEAGHPKVDVLPEPLGIPTPLISIRAESVSLDEMLQQHS